MALYNAAPVLVKPEVPAVQGGELVSGVGVTDNLGTSFVNPIRGFRASGARTTVPTQDIPGTSAEYKPGVVPGGSPSLTPSQRLLNANALIPKQLKPSLQAGLDYPQGLAEALPGPTKHEVLTPGAGFNRLGIDVPGSGGTVICTEFVNTKKISLDDYLHEKRFIDALPWRVINGYRYMAVPYVFWMRKHPKAEERTLRLTRAFVREAIALSYRKQSHSLLGLAIMAVGIPLCAVVGTFVKSTDYTILWEGN